MRPSDAEDSEDGESEQESDGYSQGSDPRHPPDFSPRSTEPVPDHSSAYSQDSAEYLQESQAAAAQARGIAIDYVRPRLTPVGAIAWSRSVMRCPPEPTPMRHAS